MEVVLVTHVMTTPSCQATTHNKKFSSPGCAALVFLLTPLWPNSGMTPLFRTSPNGLQTVFLGRWKGGVNFRHFHLLLLFFFFWKHCGKTDVFGCHTISFFFFPHSYVPQKIHNHEITIRQGVCVVYARVACPLHPDWGKNASIINAVERSLVTRVHWSLGLILQTCFFLFILGHYAVFAGRLHFFIFSAGAFFPCSLHFFSGFSLQFI